jgi:hypothetical protein
MREPVMNKSSSNPNRQAGRQSPQAAVPDYISGSWLFFTSSLFHFFTHSSARRLFTVHCPQFTVHCPLFTVHCVLDHGERKSPHFLCVIQ